MTIGVFCHNYPPHPGGLEVMVRQVASGLAARHRVTLLSAAWGEARGVAEEQGVRVHRVRAIHASEAWGVPYPVPLGPGVAAAVREMRGADVLWTHGSLYATSLLAACLARRWDKPLVLTEHVGWVPYRRRGIEALERTAWATAGRFVLATAAAATTYNLRVLDWLELRRPGLGASYVGNGVDVETFRPRPAEERAELRRRLGLPAGETLVLFVGRESEKKNLSAVLAIPRRGFRLVVCGAARRLPEDVIDLGLVPYQEMPGLFASVDAMVHASVGEGFPLAVQEAMATGVPLVLLWEEGYRRWLAPEAVEACAGPAELGPAVAALAADPAAREALGRRGREWALGRWSWRRTVGEYEVLFATLAAGGGQDRAA
jgi:D-inositol-3-phosphate glycosyltransferase